MGQRHFPKGLDDRMRDENGQIREKRTDTKIDTLRKEYVDDFANGSRADANRGTVKKCEGVESIKKFLKKQKKQTSRSTYVDGIAPRRSLGCGRKRSTEYTTSR